ncbi:MAG TPA: response regulator [Pyrinomonadaceae bacterium]|jgi:CheY-like chemotaxis protein
MPDDILIVDDFEDNRELLRLMLEGAGHRVREAESGQAGLQMALDEAPDLILVDLSMPGLDGWGVLRGLRADERTRHVPCAAVTAFDDGERESALAQGFDAYLPKPYHRTELLETVERLLARSRQGGGMTNAG